MALRPPVLTRGLSGLSTSISDNGSPAEQRDDAKKNMLKAMRPMPTQHKWNVYFDRQQKDQQNNTDGSYSAKLDQLGEPITSVQDFWRYNNNTPVEHVKMRDSVYLFKEGYKPIWEDRRNLDGGSWTFRIPKDKGPDFWTRVQLMAIGEKLQACLDTNDQLCGVGLSVRFNSHLISVWHRYADKQRSVDALLTTVLEELPEQLKPKPDNYFYKKHSDHAGFKAPTIVEPSSAVETRPGKDAAPLKEGNGIATVGQDVTH